MLVGAQHAGEVWTDAMGVLKDPVTIDQEGYGVFSCADGSMSIWVRQDQQQENAANNIENISAE